MIRRRYVWAHILDEHRQAHRALQLRIEEVVLHDVVVRRGARDDTNIIFGATFDEGLEGVIRVSVVATVATFALLAYQRHVIRRTNSVAIKADSLHYLGDLLVNGSVIVALLLVAQFGWTFIDPLFGAGIALYILYTAWQIARSALVGVGPQGAQRPVLVVELASGVDKRHWPRIAGELRHLGEGYVHTAKVDGFLRHPGPLPVDIRHNAKIGREKLAAWAARQPSGAFA